MSERCNLEILRFDRDAFEDVSGIKARPVFPWSDGTRAAFACSWGIVEPGRACDLHHHHDVEAFFIFCGKGTVRVGGEEALVAAGDVVLMKPLTAHTITNALCDEDLVFLTAFWNDMEMLSKVVGTRAQTRGCADGPSIVIGSPPTPNGDLHLGHLAGPYLGADVWTRYRRLRGYEAYNLFGVDEHQSYVAFAAQQRGIPPEHLAEHHINDIKETLSSMRIAPDVFSRPTCWPATAAWTNDLVTRLRESGDLYVAAMPNLYCTTRKKYLFEGEATGLCPRCNAPAAAGSCEACGQLFHSGDLVAPVCNICGGQPEVRPLKRLYFALARQAARLDEYIRTTVLSPRVRSLCQLLLERGLDDVPVSYPADWGVPVQIAELPGQRFMSYFTCGLSWWLGATDQLVTERISLPEPPVLWAGSGQQVIFTGFDTAIYYALIYPGMCFAYGRLGPPSAVIVNEMYRLDGEKFSTSRRHAVWGRELVERGGADAARFFLAWDRPELEETNFTLSGYDEVASAVLVNEWDTWLTELDIRVRQYSDGVAPDAGAWSPLHEDFFIELRGFSARLRGCYEVETFSLQRASRVLCDVVRSARRFARATEPLAHVPAAADELRTAIALDLLAALTMALGAAPLMPDFADHLWRALGHQDPIPTGAWTDVLDWLPAGRAIEGLGGCYFADRRACGVYHGCEV